MTAALKVVVPLEVRAIAPSAPPVAPPTISVKVMPPEPELMVSVSAALVVEFKVDPKEIRPSAEEDKLSDDPSVTLLTYDCNPVVETFVASAIPPDPVTVKLLIGVEFPIKAPKFTVKLPALTVNA